MRRGVAVVLLSWTLLTAASAQRVGRPAGVASLAPRLHFEPRELADGSESFDVLVRSDDGLFVYGHVRKPPGRGPFPGVILIHGGLGGAIGATRSLALDSTPAHALVANGYAVLSTDYRAGDWIHDDRDVVAAYEHFRAQPYVRPDAIALMGGSHGGKLTVDAIARIRPQAAVPCSGLYDLAELYRHCLRSDYHRWRGSEGGGAAGTFLKEVVEQLGGTPEEVPEAYREHSAISKVSAIETPVLVVHGEQDASVPVSFSRQLVAELRRHGKPVEAFFAEKGPHGFYWGSSAQGGFGVDYDPSENEALLERLLDFLGRHLKGG